MTPLTPEQRLEAYEYAENHFESTEYDETMGGLCGLLNSYAISNYYHAWVDHKLFELFPEFAIRKPRYKSFDVYWFPHNECGYLMRVLLILDCIEEVKGLIRK